MDGRLIDPELNAKANALFARDRSDSSRGCCWWWHRRICYTLGIYLAAYPCLYFIFGIAICFLSLGMFKIELKDRIREGYTPTYAPSRRETDAMLEFWNSTEEPLMTILLVESKTDGNMLHLSHLQESLRLQHFLLNDFICSIGISDKGEEEKFEEEKIKEEKFVFKDICGTQCLAIQFPLQQYVEHLDKAIQRLHKGESPKEALRSDFGFRSPPNILDYPTALVHYFGGFELQLIFPLPLFIPVKIHLERTFFGVKLHNNATDHNGRVDSGAEQQLTNMERVELLLLIFLADLPSTEEQNRKLALWQLAVADHIREHYRSDLLRIHVVGTEILNREMMNEGKRTIPIFALGFAVMAAFVFINVLAGAYYRYRRIGARHVVISVAMILCPILAITSTYGLLTITGYRFNSFLLILPYLIFGIGLDDNFLILHNWDSTGHIQDAKERLSIVLGRIGPSIWMTSFTNLLSFFAGMTIIPTPEVSLFCRGVVFAIGFLAIIQMFIFFPILYWTALCCGQQQKREEDKDIGRGGSILMSGKVKIVAPADDEPADHEADDEPADHEADDEPADHEAEMPADSGKPTTSCSFTRFFNSYCWLLSRPQFAAVLLVLLAAYWGMSITGALSIKSSLNTTKILPRDSPLQDSVNLLDRLVWNDYTAITLLVRSTFGDLSDQKQLDSFWVAIDEFEGLPNYKGKNFSLIWLHDYQNYFHSAIDRKMPLNSCRLDQFLDNIRYQHWRSFIRLTTGNITGCPFVDQFTSILAYNQTGTWDLRIGLMVRLREIVDKHNSTELNLVVWEQNAMFVDQMLSLKTTAIITTIFTLASMALICVCFTPNPFSVIISVLGIASICIGVFGQLYWLGFDLDPVVIAAFLMSIGLSADFCAHIVYHFQFDQHKEYRPNEGVYIWVQLTTKMDRIKFVLSTVAWPMLQAGLSTALCICPLLAIHSYAAHVFIATILLVCFIGMAHGLVVLPCLLAMLPNICTTGKIHNRLLTDSWQRKNYIDSAAARRKKQQQEEEEGTN